MMFFKRKPALIKVMNATAPKLPRSLAEIEPKTIRKPDSDGQMRRLNRTVEDNRLL